MSSIKGGACTGQYYQGVYNEKSVKNFHWMTVPKSIEIRVQNADKGKDESMRNKVQCEAKPENNGIQLFNLMLGAIIL